MAGWYVLIHQLPPDPSYLRAKIANRLARIGALALKNAVYLLPSRDSCLEDLQWIAEEAIASGGTAYIAAADWIAGVTDDDLRQRFAEAREADYRALAAEIREELATRDARAAGGRLAQLRQRLAEIAAIDWFSAPGREDAERLLERLESEADRAAAGGSPRTTAAELRGLTWVTRPDVYVDRIATAWLVRRFVDPQARFRFAAAPGRRRQGEITFDVADGDVTHEGERCTFQVLLDRLGLQDAALRAIGEIVADIDFKEPRHGHSETAGVERLLSGLAARHARDRERIERGAELFDALYAALRTAAPEKRASVPPVPAEARQEEPAAGASAEPQPAESARPRQKRGQLSKDIDAVLDDLPDVFNRYDLIKALGYEPDPSALHRVMKGLRRQGVIRLKARSVGKFAADYEFIVYEEEGDEEAAAEAGEDELPAS